MDPYHTASGPLPRVRAPLPQNYSTLRVPRHQSPLSRTHSPLPAARDYSRFFDQEAEIACKISAISQCKQEIVSNTSEIIRRIGELSFYSIQGLDQAMSRYLSMYGVRYLNPEDDLFMRMQISSNKISVDTVIDEISCIFRYRFFEGQDNNYGAVEREEAGIREKLANAEAWVSELEAKINEMQEKSDKDKIDIERIMKEKIELENKYIALEIERNKSRNKDSKRKRLKSDVIELKKDDDGYGYDGFYLNERKRKTCYRK
jgi:hypothetical protein